MSAEQPQQVVGDRYRLIELIGRGAVANVWRAHDQRLQRDVAVKLYRGDAAEELGDAEDEVRTLARLDHPGLVSVLDTGTEPDGTAWLVASYVEGQSLEQVLARGPLEPLQAAAYGAEIASALAYVHGQGFIHRDVKPANVLVGNNGRVFLTDFGIARIVDAPRRTSTGQVIGTPAFFSPEQVRGERVGPPSDVYALGLVLLEAITGERAFPGTATESAMARLARDPHIPPTLPGGWRTLLAAMTSREPARRPTASEVEQRLRALPAGASTVVAAPLDPGPPTEAMSQTAAMPAYPVTEPVAVRRPPARRGPGGALVAAALVILALVGVGVGFAVATSGGSSGPTAPQLYSPSPTLPQPLESDLQRLEQAVRQ